ncbi:helix-turn-helix transcriptional regulator [Mucilaginibacter yixingensis]|uniref:helix-turn-helix domain-containing protein n=1 Tax=Mucilaginibacter yixingensis TaxID=1295612 RepID=UPI001474AC56|nr:helix-turn-helix transcriptional regulator [Mucilaginibacter yixingensis]
MNNIRNQEYLIAFGSNLRSIRKAKGLSMEKLAQRAGIEYSQVSDIEHGKINTTISTVALIASTLEIPAKDLFDF